MCVDMIDVITLRKLREVYLGYRGTLINYCFSPILKHILRADSVLSVTLNLSSNPPLCIGLFNLMLLHWRSTFFVRIPFGKAHLPSDHVVFAIADAAEQQRKSSHMRNLEWWVQTPGSTGGAMDGQTMV